MTCINLMIRWKFLKKGGLFMSENIRAEREKWNPYGELCTINDSMSPTFKAMCIYIYVYIYNIYIYHPEV